MFEAARLKLTAWYLLIIMAVAVSFSIVVYKVILNEILRFERVQRFRIERRIILESEIPANPELIEEIKNRLRWRLIIVNFSILVVSGGLGYFLAGRTLSPISEMVEEQNRFISDASHELRTPLTSLKSAMEVHLRDKDLTVKEAKEMIEGNIGEVNKLEKLTDALLELSRFRSTKTKYSFENTDIAPIVSEAVRKITPLARKRKLEIVNTTPPIRAEVLKQELTNLLVILLDNAVKYSPENRKITITARKTGGHTAISVSDMGIGIDRKDMPYIFDRFYRSEQGRSKAQTAGYGLGLSIAKKIASLHNGKITVKSKVKQGSVFTFILPLRQPEFNPA